ncbi:hypothetical protein PIB30_013392 [Stylosanthes scabra]|uniref:F-box domain-containing protein n=1 Tax=Stylosanthes scabra TaxID=79078 RepID=A0ABU6W5X3_9FABA|nr:hypothetical protein [Stylosanthes scabra]
MEAPIHGDILEAIFSHVPLIHLVPACHVSKAWNHAVSSSLAHVNPIKPWLTILTQSTCAPHVTTTHAYDPRSRVWIEMKSEPSMKYTSAVRSSHSTLLFTLTPAGFAFKDTEEDVLRLSWHHAPAPRVWRTDPVVARVGNRVVVAGGACDFEDDLHAVEVYDMEARAWETSRSMPELLKGSMWLSVAVAGDKMLVTEKTSGVTYSFDPVSDTWHGPYDLRPDQNVFYCVTGVLAGKLTVAGVIGDKKNVKGLRLWSVEGELGSGFWFEELGEMPKEMVEKVRGVWEFGSVVVTWVGNFAYFINPVEQEEVVVCEVGNTCEWWSVRNVAAGDWTKRMVVSGGGVSLEEVQRARLCMKLL